MSDGIVMSQAPLWARSDLGIVCGHCGAGLGRTLENCAIVNTASGVMVVRPERPIHHCASMTRHDQAMALRTAGAMLKDYEWSYSSSP